MKASVVIVTKNRKDDLRRAVASALMQLPEPEVIVIDDGSTDGTPDLVRLEFPRAKLIRCEESRGYIVRRNEGARIANGELIVSIDDDAEFSTQRIVAQTIQEFDDPRVGAVAIPYIDVKIGPEIRPPPPRCGDLCVISGFVGTAHALRKDVFLALRGYRELLMHNTEERDYCLRMLNAGFVVRVGRADVIHHYQSPVRKSRWNRMMGRRNDLIHAVTNVPFPWVLLHFPGTILSGLLYGIRNGCLLETVRGYFRFLLVFREALKRRRPVTSECYFLARLLEHRGMCKLAEIEGRMTPLAVRNLLGPEATIANANNSACEV